MPDVKRKRWLIPVALALVCGWRFADWPDTIARGVARRWAPPSAEAGRAMIDKYGRPDDVTYKRMTWNRTGPWKKTVVWNRRPVYRTLEDMSVIEQTVDYPLTADQAADVLAFRPGFLEVDLRRGELSSRSDREETNVLALNLADEVARGAKTPAQAQAFYARVLSLEAAGKTSPYLATLRFQPKR